MKLVRRIDARKCPVHQALMDAAQDELIEYGYFCKDTLLRDSGFLVVSDAIRWDYVSEFLSEDLGEDLIPLAPRYWKLKPEARQASPEKCLAGGHGKKTAGYALVTVDGGALAVRKLQHKRAQANGVGKAFREYADNLIKRDMLDGTTHALADTVTN